jgi:hypothetical protein
MVLQTWLETARHCYRAFWVRFSLSGDAPPGSKVEGPVWQAHSWYAAISQHGGAQGFALCPLRLTNAGFLQGKASVSRRAIKTGDVMLSVTTKGADYIRWKALMREGNAWYRTKRPNLG